MVRHDVNPPADGWSLTLPPRLWADLARHLFPDDGDEHGAVILAGSSTGPRGPRLLGRELLLAADGVDYVEGTIGYRALSAEFVRDAALRARDERLAYLAVHNHFGTTTVGFSRVDLASHERGYPALKQITGHLVGAVVFTPRLPPVTSGSLTTRATISLKSSSRTTTSSGSARGQHRPRWSIRSGNARPGCSVIVARRPSADSEWPSSDSAGWAA
jgi:hypothetical protein